MDKLKNAVVNHGPAAAGAVVSIKVATALTAKTNWAVRTVAQVLAAIGGIALANALTKKKAS